MDEKIIPLLVLYVRQEKKPTRTVTLFKWASGSNAHRLPPTILNELSSSTLGTHIISRFGKCGGYRPRGLRAGESNRNILPVSQQARPCKARKKQRLMTNQELRTEHVPLFNLVLFGFMSYLQHNNSHRAKPRC